MIATDLAGKQCKVNATACTACASEPAPKTVNAVTAGIAIANQKKTTQAIDEDLKEIALSQASTVSGGPGTELKKLLSWFAKPTKSCNCNSHAVVMNRWGPAGCKKRKDVIAGWLVEEMQSRRVPVNAATKAALNAMVSLAIKKAEKKDAVASEDEANAAKLVAGQLAIPSKVPVETSEYQQSLSTWPFVWTYWENGAVGDELKYSIRSVLHHHPEATVCIVGDKPKWYDGPFIPKPRIARTSFQAFKDCYSKLQLACDHYEQFVWMMDDIYWIKPFSIDIAAQPKYVRHVWPKRYYDWKPSNAWAKTRAKAYAWLLENNRPTYDYASHLPQPIVGRYFKQMEHELKISENYRNFECIYFNCFHSAAGRDWGRATCRIVKSSTKIDASKPILNHIHSRYKGIVEEFLSQKFPSKCSVER